MVNDPNLVGDRRGVLDAVAELGVLFVSDPKRKSAVQILTGQFPRGSWWSHPAANEIYRVLQRVDTDPDLVSTKLLSGKVTLVHRRLWPELLAVVTAREAWQVTGLLPGTAQWLAALDEALLSGAEPPQPSRTVVKEVEARLLARGESVHTSHGRHETRLEGWPTWARRNDMPLPPAPSSAEGKRALEEAAARLGPPPVTFPWTVVGEPPTG
jgi:hypothetical protein